MLKGIFIPFTGLVVQHYGNFSEVHYLRLTGNRHGKGEGRN